MFGIPKNGLVFANYFGSILNALSHKALRYLDQQYYISKVLGAVLKVNVIFYSYNATPTSPNLSSVERPRTVATKITSWTN